MYWKITFFGTLGKEHADVNAPKSMGLNLQ